MISSFARWASSAPTAALTPPPADPSHDELLAHGHPLAKHLPLAALLKFQSLAAQRARLHAPARILSEEARAIADKIHAQQLEDGRAEAAEVRISTDEQRAAAAERRRVAMLALRAKQAELRRQIDEIEAEASGIGGLVRDLEEYAMALSAAPAMHPGVKPPTGDPAKAIAAAKKLIADIKQENAGIAASPWPSSVIKAAAVREIDAAAARGAPDAFSAIERGKPIRWPTIAPAPSSGHPRIVDAFALTAWLHRDRLVEMTLAEIDQRADDGAALSQAQRDERHADVDRRLLVAERDLEAAIVAAGPAGVLHRTRDADPRAVLGLADDAPLSDRKL